MGGNEKSSYLCMGCGSIRESDQDHSDLIFLNNLLVFNKGLSVEHIYSPSDQTHEKLSLVSKEIKEQKRDVTFSRANTRTVVAFGHVYLKLGRQIT